MPYAARTTSDDPGIGRQAIPSRGWMPVLSGCISELGYVSPVTEPFGFDATTGCAAVNPDATSRFTRRACSSVNGASYSQRTPAVIVNDGPTRQSSVMYASYEKPRKYLSALP